MVGRRSRRRPSTLTEVADAARHRWRCGSDSQRARKRWRRRIRWEFASAATTRAAGGGGGETPVRSLVAMPIAAVSRRRVPGAAIVATVGVVPATVDHRDVGTEAVGESLRTLNTLAHHSNLTRRQRRRRRRRWRWCARVLWWRRRSGRLRWREGDAIDQRLLHAAARLPRTNRVNRSAAKGALEANVAQCV